MVEYKQHKIKVSTSEEYIQKHVKSLILWLIDEVLSACGDGDATWVIKWFDISDLREFLIASLSDEDKKYWEIGSIEVNQNGERFSLVHHQESLVITTSKEDIPSWSQCTIIY